MIDNLTQEAFDKLMTFKYQRISWDTETQTIYLEASNDMINDIVIESWKCDTMTIGAFREYTKMVTAKFNEYFRDQKVKGQTIH